MTTAKAIRGLIVAILQDQKIEFPPKRNTTGLSRVLDKELGICINPITGEIVQGKSEFVDLILASDEIKSANENLTDADPLEKEEPSFVSFDEEVKEEIKPVKKAEVLEKAPVEKVEANSNNGFNMNIPGLDMNALIGQGIKNAIDGIAPKEIDKRLKKYADEALKHIKPMIIKVPERKDITMTKRVHASFQDTLFLAQIERQLFMSGPAGTGKTTLSANVAEAMGLDFSAISCSAGMSEAHLLGRMLFDGQYVQSDFVKAYENGGVFLFDEIDAADSNTLLVINSALANGYVSVPNRKDNPRATRHEDFICIVAGNTWGHGGIEYQGRNNLDAAFLDRFSNSKVEVNYDTDLEQEICGDNKELYASFSSIRKNVTKYKMRRIVSTRTFVSGVKQVTAGQTLIKVIDRFFIGWSDEEVRKALEN